MTIQIVYDVTHTYIGSVPQGARLALYTTGTPDIKATPADFAAHPNALHICQDWNASDTLADYLDVENGAATPAECPGWFKAAESNYRNGIRPEQLWPSIYASANSLTSVANALASAGITANGPGLIVANWSLTEATAIADVLAAAGPYPIVGIQFKNNGQYDTNVMSGEWINKMSGPSVPVTPVTPNPKANVPPGQWLDAGEWEWKDCIITGVGTDNNLYVFAFNPVTGQWFRQSLPGVLRD